MNWRDYPILHFDVQFSLLAPKQNAEHAFPITFCNYGIYNIYKRLLRRANVGHGSL